ncbi:MAG: hypothetical protein PHI62_05065 [Candidatus Methanomethylophilaceae archaeon]|jgi:hypothetical protein|nr:hypothetical protein [Candidatus Methanomethylophilaceae archaeon]MDD4245520.1 hypothetical protein [Candidatus Methanomethylophilaceae archaeon]
MWLEDWFLSLREDPEKLAKVFKTIWIVSYSVLILGFFLIIYALLFL